jgi:hypothetical protein
MMVHSVRSVLLGSAKSENPKDHNKRSTVQDIENEIILQQEVFEVSDANKLQFPLFSYIGQKKYRTAILE